MLYEDISTTQMVVPWYKRYTFKLGEILTLGSNDILKILMWLKYHLNSSSIAKINYTRPAYLFGMLFAPYPTWGDNAKLLQQRVSWHSPEFRAMPTKGAELEYSHLTVAFRAYDLVHVSSSLRPTEEIWSKTVVLTT